jgi:hypothetical protein
MKHFLKVFGIILGIVFLFIMGIYLYLKYINLAYRDTKYGFTFLNQRGWKNTEQPKVYYSIATVDPNNEILSTMNILPLNINVISDNQIYNFFNNNCKNNSNMMGDTTKLIISQVRFNNLKGWVCTYEGTPANVPANSRISIIKDYVLYKNANQRIIFMLKVTYPKGSDDELQKVNRLVNSFLVI